MIAALDGGTFYHDRAFRDLMAASVIERRIWIRVCDDDALDRVTTLVVPCRSSPAELVRLSETLARFMARGGFLVVMGETRPDLWLKGVELRPCATNWWWWLDPAASLGLTVDTPGHEFWRHVKPGDCAWHVHGTLTPPPGAIPLLHAADGGLLAYDDAVSHAPGRAFVTTLDPFYHHGSEFMPATTRFLAGFLPWLARADRDWAKGDGLASS
jgi:hypothetical protein